MLATEPHCRGDSRGLTATETPGQDGVILPHAPGCEGSRGGNHTHMPLTPTGRPWAAPQLGHPLRLSCAGLTAVPTGCLSQLPGSSPQGCVCVQSTCSGSWQSLAPGPRRGGPEPERGPCSHWPPWGTLGPELGLLLQDRPGSLSPGCDRWGAAGV